MRLLRSVLISLVAVVVIYTGVLVWAFMTSMSVSVPLFLDIESRTNRGGTPESYLSFSPLGPFIVFVLIATVVYLSLWVGSIRKNRGAGGATSSGRDDAR
jgi:hypothetical protein